MKSKYICVGHDYMLSRLQDQKATTSRFQGQKTATSRNGDINPRHRDPKTFFLRTKSHDIKIPGLKNYGIEIPRLKSHDIEFPWNSEPYAP